MPVRFNTSGGGIDPDELTARPEHVLNGKTFAGNGSDEAQRGSMIDLSNQSLERDGNTANIKKIDNLFETTSGKGADVTIALQRQGFVKNTQFAQAIYGVHPDVVKYGQPIGANPSGGGFYVTGKFTGDANASAYDIRKGKTAYVKGNKIEGIMTEKGAATYIPNTVDQKIWGGQYLAGDQTIKGDPNLVATNIKKGVTIFGVTGTWEGYVPTVNDLYLYGNQLVPWICGLKSSFDEAQILLNDYIKTQNFINLVGYNYLNVQYNVQGAMSDTVLRLKIINLNNQILMIVGTHKDINGENIASFSLENAQVNRKIELDTLGAGLHFIKRIWLS